MTKLNPAPAETGINPKLAAIAAKLDKVRAEFHRVLKILAVAEQKAWYNREDRAAQAALDEAHSAEIVAGSATTDLAEQFSNIVAKNLDELKFKARYASPTDCDDSITLSIIRDLLAMDRKSKGAALQEARATT